MAETGNQPALQESPAGSILRFGVFEVNVRAGELRKHGIKIKLQDQPFHVLACLLERVGQVVTREELRKRIWPDDTFVDFDHGLNKAINKIRDALGDSSDSPRFVETLPRRGYRFIAPVAAAPRSDMSAAVTSTSGGGYPAPDRRKGIRLAAVVVLVVAGAAVAAVTLVRSPSSQGPKILGYNRITNDGARKVWETDSAVRLVSDGSRVYFAETSSATVGLHLAEVSATGGDTSSLPAPYEYSYVADISPNSPELLILSGKPSSEPDLPLWIAPIRGGALRRVGSLLAIDAAWSPDGQTIAYAKGGGLYTAKVDGSESHKVVDLENNACIWQLAWPRWSPNGKSLRFTGCDPVTRLSVLWEVSGDGSGLRRLFPQRKDRNECCGSWTPGGKYFVFESQSTDGRGANIWAIRESRGFSMSKPEPEQLTSGPLSFLGPSPSPDGKRLFVIGSQIRGELVRYDRQSGRFVGYLAGLSAEGLDFSRDGEWLTYVAYPEGTLWRGRVDGSQRLRLTDPDMRVGMPRWSPDGRWIAFQGTKASGGWKIYVVSAAGGTSEQLARGQDPQLDPNWSPDGKSLVFGESFTTATPRIHVLDLGSRQVSTLPASDGLYCPRWSPDGRFIAALTKDSLTLSLFEVRSGKWSRWTEGAFLVFPSWSRDSKYVYARGTAEGEAAFYRVRVGDHKLEKVSDVRVGSLAAGVFGSWTGLAPDNAPLLLRDTSFQEIYALDWRLP
jgi:Tol biopolymer transport system component/DNA-binding winged helix-turn-helix (wHTH) protein